ncbi:MAG TPA: glycosyltransferase family 39 protein, partial [Nannocystis sp.]
GEEKGALTFRANYYYSGGFDALGAAFRWLARPMDPFMAMHLLSAMLGVLGVVGTWRLGRRLGGPFVGLVAGLLLAFNPVYFGHMFNNPKDLPFAVAYVWAIHAMVGVIAALPRPTRAQWGSVAVTIAAAMSVRIGGVLLLCYLGLIVALYAFAQGRARRSVEAGLEYLWRIGGRALLTALGAWVLMLMTWPWALLDPLRRPFIALTHMSKFLMHKRLMPFKGEDISTFDIGRDYLPTYFGIQLPEVVLLFGLLGTVYGVYTLARHGHRQRVLVPALALLLLGLSIWLPPIYAIYKKSVLYDAYRHFLFVVPPLSVLAALVVDRLAAPLCRRSPRLGAGLVGGVLLAVCLDLGVTMHRLHPHEYIYFNRLVGGLGGAHGNYDTDYYGNTYKEAFTGLRDHLWREDPAAYLDTMYYFRGCISGYTASHYLPPNFRIHRTRPGGKRSADFHVGYTRGHCDQRFANSPVLFTVEREGAALNVVRDLRPGARRRLEGAP